MPKPGKVKACFAPHSTSVLTISCFVVVISPNPFVYSIKSVFMQTIAVSYHPQKIYANVCKKADHHGVIGHQTLI